MAQASIPVDLFNPGQVFACLGFLEVSNQLLGEAVAGFDCRDDSCTRFVLNTVGDQDPFEGVLRLFGEATVFSLAPPNSQLSTEKWAVATRTASARDTFPFTPPDSPATLPAIIEINRAGGVVERVNIDHWGDSTTRDNVKFWAGSGGYPGAALAADALRICGERIAAVAKDPFSFSAPQTSSFRFDWRRDYIAMDLGFSPNHHNDVSMTGFPIVELMAAIGLGNARPRRLDKLRYRYCVIEAPNSDFLVQPLFHRAALGGSLPHFPCRAFIMHLGWPGQENQARCITEVIEEN